MFNVPADAALEIIAPSAITIAEDDIEPNGVLVNVTVEGTSDPVTFTLNADDPFKYDITQKALVLKSEPLDYESMDSTIINVTFRWVHVYSYFSFPFLSQ